MSPAERVAEFEVAHEKVASQADIHVGRVWGGECGATSRNISITEPYTERIRSHIHVGGVWGREGGTIALGGRSRVEAP